MKSLNHLDHRSNPGGRYRLGCQDRRPRPGDFGHNRVVLGVGGSDRKRDIVASLVARRGGGWGTGSPVTVEGAAFHTHPDRSRQYALRTDIRCDGSCRVSPGSTISLPALVLNSRGEKGDFRIIETSIPYPMGSVPMTQCLTVSLVGVLWRTVRKVSLVERFGTAFNGVNFRLLLKADRQPKLNGNPPLTDVSAGQCRNRVSQPLDRKSPDRNCRIDPRKKMFGRKGFLHPGSHGA